LECASSLNMTAAAEALELYLESELLLSSGVEELIVELVARELSSFGWVVANLHYGHHRNRTCRIAQVPRRRIA